MLGLMHVLEVVALHLYPMGGRGDDRLPKRQCISLPLETKQLCVSFIMLPLLTLHMQTKMSIMTRGRESRSKKGKVERCKKKKGYSKMEVCDLI